MNPTLSIIVPVFNVEKYIKKCIESILNQSFKDFELILIDDGSPDRCGEICDEYAKQDIRIRVIHKKNEGLSSARNVGLNVARGKYIGFVDSDDYIHRDMYNIMVSEIEKCSTDLAICNYKEFKEQTFIEEELKSKYVVKILNQHESLEQLYKVNGTYVFAWNKLYKKELFNKLRYREGRIYEDEFLIHHILYKCKSVVFIDKELYYYLQREGSIVNSKFSIKKFDKIYALAERIAFFKENNELELKEKAENYFIKHFIWNYIVAYQRIDDIEDELKCLKREFNNIFIDIMLNKLIGFKEKITLIIFYISPSIYNKLVIGREL